MATKDKLAILGGEPAVTIDSSEQWKRPVEEEKRLVNELLDQGILSGAGSGLPKEFEEEFRKVIGSEYCLTTDHGTTALESAYYAAGVGPGDEVIQPTFTWICSYSGAMTHMGAKIVFCDIDPKTLLLDPNDVERKITKNTRAIVPVHMCGNVCDMDAFMDIGRRYGIAIIEDCAHATGAEWDGKKVGNVGDIGCFSLQGSNPGGKPVCGGEGGVTTTNNRELYERMLISCHLNRSGIRDELTNPEYRKLANRALGIKSRAYPLALAIAKVSLKSFEYRNRRREEHRKKVFDALRELPGLDPVHSYPKAKPSGFYGGLNILYSSDELGGLPASKFVEAMKAEGAPISGPGLALEHLIPLFTQGFDIWGKGRGPFGKGFKSYKKGDCPVAESLVDKVLTISPYIDLKEGFLDQYIEAFQKVTSNYQYLL
ncbi:DegT/DnrJ/EryC1/StrS family aminotransferase [bacterium]|nr:DegT/DnrJ/EryC1/StrS family aminotransferase [bacterium]